MGEEMHIATSKADGILVIEFNRLEKKNAITAAMYQAMADALADGESDPSVRVLLIQGKPEIFTAGNDLDDFMRSPPKDGEAPVHQFMRQLSQASKPVIAAVAGAAVGIGTTMLLHCDMVYAGTSARFSMPFAQLGLCPEFASSMLFSRIAGYQRAAELLMFGEAFSAEQGHGIGLVNKVVPDGELREYARERALALAALPASSLRATKKLMKAEIVARLPAVMVEESRQFGAMLHAPEAKEAFSAFFERRKPDFSKFR